MQVQENTMNHSYNLNETALLSCLHRADENKRIKVLLLYKLAGICPASL